MIVVGPCEPLADQLPSMVFAADCASRLRGKLLLPPAVPLNVGVVIVGLVANTTLPLPVVLAALIAVPLPCKTPLIEVFKVITGVVVGLATVAEKPFAVATPTLATVPLVIEAESHVA